MPQSNALLKARRNSRLRRSVVTWFFQEVSPKKACSSLKYVRVTPAEADFGGSQ
jgi:hypothetical protein